MRTCKVFALVAICTSPALYNIGTVQAQNRNTIFGKNYTFIDDGQQCISRCRPFRANGRVQFTRDGKILYFFPTNGAASARGILLDTNRSVDLARGGRLPRGFKLGDLFNVRSDANFEDGRYLTQLTLTNGVATTSFDGQNLVATLQMDFAGPATDRGAVVGSATTRVQFTYTYRFDPGTGSLVGGQGNIQATVTGAVNGSPLNASFTSDSRVTPT